jgi:nitrite reductase/ring-hydroxylating ferredoxin subunit
MSEQPSVTLVPLGAPRGRQAWIIKHNGRSYAVFDIDGELQVTDAACPHNGGPLAEGVVRDGVVTCPWHWYSFELRSGLCRTAAAYQLRKYPVVGRDGVSYAELPDEVRRFSWSELLRAHARSRRLCVLRSPATVRATAMGPEIGSAARSRAPLRT